MLYLLSVACALLSALAAEQFTGRRSMFFVVFFALITLVIMGERIIEAIEGKK